MSPLASPLVAPLAWLPPVSASSVVPPGTSSVEPPELPLTWPGGPPSEKQATSMQAPTTQTPDLAAATRIAAV